MNNELMNEQTQQGNETATENAGEQGRTFTQDELNQIVSDRLARDRERHAAQLDAREQQLVAREKDFEIVQRRAVAYDTLAAAGLPSCADALLDFSSDEALTASLERTKKVVEELHHAWELKRATGRVPKRYDGPTADPDSDLRRAFKI